MSETRKTLMRLKLRLSVSLSMKTYMHAADLVQKFNSIMMGGWDEVGAEYAASDR